MGKKKLVSLGFNYRHYSGRIPPLIPPLNGPTNSARDFADFLVNNHEFEMSDITLITDDEDPQKIRAASEILEILKEKFMNPESGDTLVLYMSGHGVRSPSPNDNNNSGFVESFICGGPMDSDGVRSSTVTTLLTDVDLRVACTVPNGCNMTVIADCCNSGGIVEGLNEIAGVSTLCPTTGKLDKKTSLPSNAILFSACQSGDFTGEVHIPSRGKFVAYFTKKLITASKSLGRFQSNKQIYDGIIATLDKRTYILPGLYGNRAQMNIQFLGNHEFISKIEWPIIEYKTLLKGSKVISKTEIRESFAILEDLKYDWPVRWKKFNDLVSASIQSEVDSVNCMQILKNLLSKEFFDFLGGGMEVKQSMNSEFQLIHELCLYLLSTLQSDDAICAVLSTFQGFISRIPLHSIIASSTVETLVKLFQEGKFRVHTLPCLREVASLKVGDFFDVLHVKMHDMVVNEIQIITPLTINTPEAYAHVSSSEKAFILNLALFFTSFYKVHIHILEFLENPSTLQLGLDRLIQLSYVDDIRIFMVCLNYWKSLVSELLDDSASPFRKQQKIYTDTMSKLRTLMISRMAKPDEFLLIKDDNGNIVRETLTDSDVLHQYKIMKETLIGLVRLDRSDTKTQMLQRLGEQLSAVQWKFNNYEWDTLNTLCWAIGSISGSFENVEEKDMFSASVIHDLLKLCKMMKGTKNKAVMASNFMYVLGQFQNIDLHYYEDIIHMLLKFMAETCPAVQDMACEKFLEKAQNFKCFLETQVNKNEQPFVSEILSRLPAATADLEPHNVHSFYESVAHMIQAGSESKRDVYLQDLMDIPNKKFYDLIETARLHQNFLYDQNVTQDLFHILQIYTSVASSLGKSFMPQFTGGFNFSKGILSVHSQCSALISKSISEGKSCESKALKLLHSIRREILKLFKTYLEKAQNLEPVNVESVLQHLGNDYKCNGLDARESEVLSLFATTVKKFKATITVAVTDIMMTAVRCITEMIIIGHVDYPDRWFKLSSLLGDMAAHCPPALFKLQDKMIIIGDVDYPDCWLKLSSLLGDIAAHCPPALFELQDKELDLVMQSILCSFRFKEWNVRKTSLGMLNQIQDKSLLDRVFPTYFLDIMDQIIMSLRDTTEHEVNLHASVLYHLFSLLVDNGYRDLVFPSSLLDVVNEEVKGFIVSLLASTHNFYVFETAILEFFRKANPVQDMEWDN